MIVLCHDTAMTSDIHHYDDGKPLNRSETIKRQLERDAAKHFLRLYEQEYKTPMRNIWHNEPSRPDISCHLDGKPLDLEIAHLYANANEAKILTHEISAPNNPATHSLAKTPTVDPLPSSDTPLALEVGSPDQVLFSYLFELTKMNSKKRLTSALSQILSNKSNKTYNSNRVWLVIRNVSPLWQVKDFKQYIKHFPTPVNKDQESQVFHHPFEQIWLLPDFAGNEPPIRLF